MKTNTKGIKYKEKTKSWLEKKSTKRLVYHSQRITAAYWERTSKTLRSE